MINRYALSGLALAGLVQPAGAYDVKTRVDLEPLIVKHATANNVPPALVHRIIIRESRYNARAVGRGGALGLMQIKHGTARALGYAGAPAGLLDADTNLTYGVRYLAGAYRVANGDQNRAVGYYARGYYYDAKRRGLHGAFAKGEVVVEEPTLVAAAPPPTPQPPSLLAALFSPPRPAEPVQVVQQAVVEEPESPPPGRRGGRSANRRTSAANSPAQSASGQPVSGQIAVQSVATELEAARSGPSAKRKPGAAAASSPQSASVQTNQAGVQSPLTESAMMPAVARSAKRKAQVVAGSPARAVESAPISIQSDAKEGATAASPERTNGPAKYKAAPAGQSAAVQPKAAQGSVQMIQADTKTSVAPRQEARSGPRTITAVNRPTSIPRASSVEIDGTVADGPETPATRSSRSAKRKAAAGAGRSAQKASEQPADPGRVP